MIKGSRVAGYYLVVLILCIELEGRTFLMGNREPWQAMKAYMKQLESLFDSVKSSPISCRGSLTQVNSVY